MRFPHRARSRRPNPEPASLIAPVVSSNSPCVLVSTSFENRSKVLPPLEAFYGRKAPSDRFSPRKLRSLSKAPRPFTVERISCLSARSEKTPRVGSRARRARARLHTRTSATHERPRHDVSLAIRLVCTSRRHVRRRTVRARVFPSSPRPREDHAEALGVDERGRVRRARVPDGRRGGLRRRAVAQRAGRDVLPLRLRGGAAVRVRAAPASRRARAREPSSPPRRTVSLTLFSSRRRDALNPSSDEPARAPSWVWGRSAASPRSDTPPASASGARRGSSRAGSAAGAVRGAVYREVRRGLRATRGRDELRATTSNRLLQKNCSTLWDLVCANPELSSLRALLANDVPWVAATLDGKTLAEGADPAAAFPPGEPYDADAPGLAPLVDENTGAFHVDTLFAPNDAAVDALSAYLLGGNERMGAETDRDPDPLAPAAAPPPRPLAAPRPRCRCWARGTPPPRRCSWRTTCHPTRLRLPELRRARRCERRPAAPRARCRPRRKRRRRRRLRRRPGRRSRGARRRVAGGRYRRRRGRV